jgi:hypothetical protein
MHFGILIYEIVEGDEKLRYPRLNQYQRETPPPPILIRLVVIV